MVTTRQPTPPQVLVVDDNRDAADTTGQLLELVGCDVHVCYDGFAALEWASDHPPDICFIDLNMPGMDGDELAVRLRDALPGVPIRLAAVTAMSGFQDRWRTRRAGFRWHLVKPVDPGDFWAIVHDRGGPTAAVE